MAAHGEDDVSEAASPCAQGSHSQVHNAYTFFPFIELE